MKLAVAIAPMLAALISLESGAAEFLQQVGTIALPGVNGRFDHLAVDPKGHRLFVAALGNNTLEIVDVAANKRIHSIRDIQKPTGVAFLADKNQIAVAAGNEGVFKVFSGADYKLANSVGALDDADNVRVDASGQRVFVGYGEGALAILEAKTFKKLGDVKLAGHPESFQLVKAGARIFVNVPGAKEIAVVDWEKGSVVARVPMGELQSNFPMALDEANHRLFVGCRRPARLVVFDTQRNSAMGNVEISDDTDDLFFDAKRNRVYVSCGEGFVEVVDCAPGAPLKRGQKSATRPGARTSFYSAELDRFYLAVPKRGSDAAEIRVYQPVD